jgi:hypothetical protein
MLLVSDPQRMSDHGAGILALKDLIPDPAEMPDDEDDAECEWSFGGPLGDEEPDEAPVPWEPGDGQPLEQESFYF